MTRLSSTSPGCRENLPRGTCTPLGQMHRSASLCPRCPWLFPHLARRLPCRNDLVPGQPAGQVLRARGVARWSGPAASSVGPVRMTRPATFGQWWPPARHTSRRAASPSLLSSAAPTGLSAMEIDPETHDCPATGTATSVPARHSSVRPPRSVRPRRLGRTIRNCQRSRRPGVLRRARAARASPCSARVRPGLEPWPSALRRSVRSRAQTRDR